MVNETLINYPHISINGNKKLGEFIPGVNLPAGTTCRADAPCRKGCYAMKGHFVYSNVMDSLSKNLTVFLDNSQRYFDKIEYFLRMAPYAHFRYHSSGDIVNEEYLKGMVRVAQNIPNTRFLCFTKKFELVNKYIDNGGVIPENLIIVFSHWSKDFEVPNPHNLPCAYVRFKKLDNSDIPENANQCSGFCGDCVRTDSSCWKLQKGESVVFNQH